MNISIFAFTGSGTVNRGGLRRLTGALAPQPTGLLPWRSARQALFRLQPGSAEQLEKLLLRALIDGNSR